MSDSGKATISGILVSHQELSLKFVWLGGHYHYTIIPLYHYSPTTKSLTPGLARPRSL